MIPFTTADEVTDPHANQEIPSVCLSFIDFTAPHLTIKECLINLVYLERVNAPTIANQHNGKSLTSISEFRSIQNMWAGL